MRIRSVLVIAVVFLCMSVSAAALSIGLSPGRIDFDNVLREGYAERTISISTSTEDILFGRFQATGDIAEWVRFEPNVTTFNTTKGDPYRLTVIVEPPEDLANGNYSGTIEFISETVGGIDGRAGGVVKAAVGMALQVEVSGDEIIDCRAGGLTIEDTEENFPFVLSYRLINDGNVRLSPTISLAVWDLDRENIVETYEVQGDLVFPTTELVSRLDIEQELPLGQYWVDIDVQECNVQAEETISIVEKGAIIDKGVLNGIFSKQTAAAFETVEFLANFQNDGPRAVTANFEGVVRLDGRIVAVINSNEQIIDPGQLTDFSLLFTPEEAGRYVLEGRVIYNKKLTFERSAVLNVNPPAPIEQPSTWLPTVLYFALLVIILLIVRMIWFGKRKRKF